MPETQKSIKDQNPKHTKNKQSQQAHTSAREATKATPAAEPAQALEQVIRDFVAANARFAEQGKNSPLFPAIADSTFDGLNTAAAALSERTLRQIQEAPAELTTEWARQTEDLAVPEMLRAADQLIAQIPTGAIYLNLNPPQPTLLDCIKDLLKCIVKALPFLPPLVTEIFCCLYEAACCFARL